MATFVTFFLLTKMEDGTGADRDLTNVKRDLAAPLPNVRWREMGVSRSVEEGSVELVVTIINDPMSSGARRSLVKNDTQAVNCSPHK